METIIKIDSLYKEYRLGTIGYGTLREDLESWWARFRGKRDPNSIIGQENKNNSNSEHFLALDDINLEIKRGERLGIIGKNGAGKTTLLKILSRISSPTKGSARIKGRVASLIAIGTGFHPEFTGRENIYLNGSILGLRKFEIDKRFDEIVDFSDIDKFIDTPVKRYSSGMYVRLGFAIAAHLDPDVLIVDEVLAVGDADFQKKALGKMENVSHGEGRTILFVSHNMSSIINLCNRAILLNEGKIVADGKADKVVRQYLSTGDATDGEVVWANPDDAPGNETVRLYSVKILQDGVDGPAEVVNISKEIKIEITYQNFMDNCPLYVAIWLNDKMGIPVLASENSNSSSLTKDTWYGKPYPKGVFQSICIIPGNFLNDDIYYITPIIGDLPDRSHCEMILEEDLISFKVQDFGEMRKSGFYGNIRGTVRPKLKWDTKKIE